MKRTINKYIVTVNQHTFIQESNKNKTIKKRSNVSTDTNKSEHGNKNKKKTNQIQATMRTL